MKPLSSLTSSALVLLSVTLGGVFFVAGQVLSVKQQAKEETRASISVQGMGRVFASPDIAVLNFGIATGRQSTAQRALEVLTENMDAIIAAARERGVEERDISTQYLYLNPAYDWIDGQQVSRGFEANQNLSVKVRDINTIGAILTAATGAGANQIGGVTMTVDDPEELREQAREQAIMNAKEKAKNLSRELGVSLGRLTSFTEGAQTANGPVYDRAYAEGMGGGGGLSVPGGEQEIVIYVTLGYEVK